MYLKQRAGDNVLGSQQRDNVIYISSETRKIRKMLRSRFLHGVAATANIRVDIMQQSTMYRN